jgi:hypothetical protein
MFIRDAADFYINTRYIKAIYIEYGFRTDGLDKDILISADLDGDIGLVRGVYKRYIVSPNSAILAVFDDDDEGLREAKHYLALMASRINHNIVSPNSEILAALNHNTEADDHD